jgi:hypothetical protein
MTLALAPVRAASRLRRKELMETHTAAIMQHTLHANCVRQSPVTTQAQCGQDGVWSHVIEALVAGDDNALGREPHLQARMNSSEPYVPSRHVQVSVIERLTDTSVSVRWRDATRCHYDDQVWISCRARNNGRCALSGAAIRRHDFVYKPRARSIAPANANAMILASLIACVPTLT